MKISYKFMANDGKVDTKDREFEIELCQDSENPILNILIDGKEVLWLGDEELKELIKALEDIKEKIKAEDKQ